MKPVLRKRHFPMCAFCNVLAVLVIGQCWHKQPAAASSASASASAHVSKTHSKNPQKGAHTCANSNNKLNFANNISLDKHGLVISQVSMSGVEPCKASSALATLRLPGGDVPVHVYPKYELPGKSAWPVTTKWLLTDVPNLEVVSPGDDPLRSRNFRLSVQDSSKPIYIYCHPPTSQERIKRNAPGPVSVTTFSSVCETRFSSKRTGVRLLLRSSELPLLSTTIKNVQQFLDQHTSETF